MGSTAFMKRTKEPLYRKVNTRAHGVHHNFGGDYRHERNSKKKSDLPHESMHGATILRLVEYNLGISIMPVSYRQSAAMRVKFIELKDIPERTQLSMAWRKNDTNPILQKFLKVADEMVF